MKILLAFAAILFSLAADAQVSDKSDKQRLINETCNLISQQRNNLSDAAAVAEARFKISQERVEQWEAYFKAYLGEAKS